MAYTHRNDALTSAHNTIHRIIDSCSFQLCCTVIYQTVLSSTRADTVVRAIPRLNLLSMQVHVISVPYLNMMTLVLIVLCSYALSKHPRAESVEANLKSGGELVHSVDVMALFLTSPYNCTQTGKSGKASLTTLPLSE